MKTISVHEESTYMILWVVNNYPISWDIPFNVYLNRGFFLPGQSVKDASAGSSLSVCGGPRQRRRQRRKASPIEEVIIGALTGKTVTVVLPGLSTL